MFYDLVIRLGIFYLGFCLTFIEQVYEQSCIVIHPDNHNILLYEERCIP